MVLVFYYGYHCNHCVGQLFALHDDISKFRELGAEVVAVSADPPEWTRERWDRAVSELESAQRRQQATSCFGGFASVGSLIPAAMG